MKKTIFVLGVSRYDFSDENGRQVKGAKVHYVDFSQSTESESVYGRVPTSANIPYESFDQLRDGTGFYEVDLDVDLSGRKPKLVFSQFRLLEKVDLQAVGTKF